MADPKIEPALTAEEWRLSRASILEELSYYFSSNGDATEPLEADLPAIIAFANAALPDSDPRKITRGQVGLLRGIVHRERRGAILGERGIALDDVDCIERIADALESYLPPNNG